MSDIPRELVERFVKSMEDFTKQDYMVHANDGSSKYTPQWDEYKDIKASLKPSRQEVVDYFKDLYDEWVKNSDPVHHTNMIQHAIDYLNEDKDNG